MQRLRGVAENDRGYFNRMRSSKEFRALARQRLTGKWGMSILISFVAALLGGTGGGGAGFSSGFSSSFNFDASNLPGAVSAGLHNLWENPLIRMAVLGTLAVGGIISLALFIIGGAVELGQARYYIGLMGGETPEFSILFSRFSIFLKALGLRLYMFLFVFLWSLLLIVPGIIAAYRYAMAPYLMAQYPDKGIVECVNDSKALMAGNKGRLFLLSLSFIGWALLCLLTAGLGTLWLNPYTQAAIAGFYLERTGQMPGPYRGGGWDPQPQA